MDSTPATPPRLRVSRYSLWSKSDHNLDTPQAGPSRISPRMNALDVPHYDSEDDQATPRVTTKPALTNGPETTMSGTERLRAVLSRAKGAAGGRPSPTPTPPPPAETSDMMSDFESPHATVAQSIHQQTLKDFFAHMTSDLTPQKKGKTPVRRNSLESEVEGSPRVELVQRERAKHKGKRKSLSDEEAEKHMGLNTSPGSFRLAAAARYDALRSMLTSSGRQSPKSQARDDPGPAATPGASSSRHMLSGLEPMSDTELSAAETSGDTAKFAPHLDSQASLSTPPMATSTPMRTLQFPSQLQLQSNLLDQDSEMHQAMKGLESMEGDSTVHHKRVPFPPTRSGEVNGHGHTSGHSHSHGRAHSLSHSAHNLPLARKVSAESRTSSRSSSLSASDRPENKLYERERQWNKPSPKPPSTPESHRRNSHSSPSYHAAMTADRGSPGHSLSRRGSLASMRSFDDGRSSVGSSLSSHADHRDRMKELEQEKNRERERMWNKPRPRRSSSDLSFNSPNERTRTQSGPSRPDSSMSFHSPRRHPSWGSASSSSRPGSPAGSIASVDREMESRNPVVSERERNWNSPHPKWEHQVVNPRRSLSPPQRTASPATSRYRLSIGSPSELPNGRHSSRTRTVSLGNEHTPSKSVVRTGTDSRLLRVPSPTHSEAGDEDYGEELEQFKSRFGWSMSRNRISLPPLGSDSDSPQKMPSTPPGSRPSSRLSARPSLIPIRSPRKNGHASSPPQDGGRERRLGHRRDQAPLTEPAKPLSRSRIEPLDLMNVEGDIPVDPADLVPTDSESEAESQVTSTPVGRPPPLPDSPDADLREPSPPPSPSPSPPSRYVSLAPQEERMSPELSPLEKADDEFLLGLATPPMQSMSLSSKLEFQTPSPPRNMPDLPAPPSSSEDETETLSTPAPQREVDMIGNLTAMKTPRPPGAWAATPAPSKDDSSDAQPGPRVDDTPLPGGEPSSIAPTPAPPGAWQATPVGSLRRRSILKVRFDVESNTSGDTSLPEVPVIGPSDPGDSVSEIFPSINPSGRKSDQAAYGNNKDAESPGTPTTPRLRSHLKSPGVRVLDAFGNETVESPVASSSRDDEEVEPLEPEPVNKATPRSRSAVRIVDAMGREVLEPEATSADSSTDLGTPTSHRDALARIRATVAKMADDMGESDDSVLVPVREDERMNQLRQASQSSLKARKALAESLQKHRVSDVAKYGSLRESMQKNQLLPPTVRSSRFSVDFLNTWVLWTFLVFQVLLIIYMYRLSTIRAKRIFLTTYYDAFSPELFTHLSTSDSSALGIPSSSSPSLSLLSLSETLSQAGWKGVFLEVWTYISAVILDWLNSLWDAWGWRPGRTIAWPPT